MSEPGQVPRALRPCAGDGLGEPSCCQVHMADWFADNERCEGAIDVRTIKARIEPAPAAMGGVIVREDGRPVDWKPSMAEAKRAIRRRSRRLMKRTGAVVMEVLTVPEDPPVSARSTDE